MFNKTMAAILLTISAALPGLAQAQGKPMKLESTVQLVQPAEEGDEPRLVAAEGVVPGDTLVFTTSYRNEGGATVTDFVIVNPVPADLVLSDEAAGQTEVSVDGGAKWGPLSDLTVLGEDHQERPATIDDITHMRWAIAEVPPAGAGQVRFSARVR